MSAEFPKFRCRASSFGKLMSDPVGVSPEKTLSDTLDRIDKLEEKIASTANKETKTYLSNIETLKTLEESIPLLEEKAKEPFLSKTAIGVVRDFYTTRMYGVKEISNKYTEKGKIQEPLAIELLGQYFDWFMPEKSNNRKTNEWFTGECDIERPDRIVDVKCSWDESTFPFWDDVIPNKDYEGQVQGYMNLYDKPFASVIYVLMDCPEELLRKMATKICNDSCFYDDYDVIYEQVKQRYTFSHLPLDLRIKEFKFERDDSYIEEMKYRVIKAREYAEKHIKPIYNKWQIQSQFQGF